MTAASTATLGQLQTGLEAHRRGEFAEAERQYRAVLAAAPEALDAYNLLGRLLVQTSRAHEASALLRRAIDMVPDQPALWLSYAEALLAAGQTEAATSAADTVQRLAPNDPDAQYIWAETQRLGRNWDLATKGYRRAIRLRPANPAAWLQLASCLRELGELAEAVKAAQEALRLAPQAPECHNNLANLLVATGQHEAALQHFRQALQLRPHYPSALINMGAALRELGRTAEAIPLLEQALVVSQGHPEAHAALALARHNLGEMAAAIRSYREALARRPEDAETQWNYALAALATGDFAPGWPAFAWRWRKAEPPLPRRQWPWPAWRHAGAQDGQRLLLWGEQGLGDRLLFLQYLPDLLAQGARVTLETDPRLIPLLRRSFPNIAFAEEGREPAASLLDTAFDAQAALGDLPDRPPPGLAYLKADQNRAQGLRARYCGMSNDRLIGLSWRSANPKLGEGKSLRPADLAPLAAVADCRFICLQYGATDAEHAAFRALFGERYIADPAIDAQNDLDALAAQIAALDLTLTVSNVTAHLAGAQGRPVWVFAPAGKSLFFYLMAEGDGTPWYPSMRIFRSPAAGVWEVPVQAAIKRLESLAK
ncbi:MAG TPA: tetratricopeptide repeat protein [Ferrovibrio sp.]|uniref:tetratricopeptide repeat protein n=1 Tax=Ferrovibrio sp. TaxID=1917215 RepID=UPI002ECFB91D